MSWPILLFIWWLIGLVSIIYFNWRDGFDLHIRDLLFYLLLALAGLLPAICRLKFFGWVVLRGKR